MRDMIQEYLDPMLSFPKSINKSRGSGTQRGDGDSLNVIKEGLRWFST